MRLLVVDLVVAACLAAGVFAAHSRGFRRVLSVGRWRSIALWRRLLLYLQAVWDLFPATRRLLAHVIPAFILGVIVARMLFR